MKNIAIFLLLSTTVTACLSQPPDYLSMLNPAELKQIMQNQDILLIDVHTPEQQHIKGTDLTIPYNQVEQHLDKLPQDKSTPIFLYCRSDSMATTAAKTLHELGYQNLSNLKGGANAWRNAGFDFE